MCFEDYGRWGTLSLEFIRDKIVFRAPGNAAERLAFHVYWRRRLAVTTARGVARLIASRSGSLLPGLALRDHSLAPARTVTVNTFERSSTGTAPGLR